MSDSLAVQTQMALGLYAYEAADYYRECRGPAQIVQTGELKAAERDYYQALNAEIAAVKSQSPNLHPKPLAKTTLRRAQLMLRGTARLTVGVVLGIAWCATGGCLMRKSDQSKTGNFALGICCEGGVSDIKRANAPASVGLAAKREYQLHMALQDAYVLGQYGPLPAPVASALPTADELGIR